MKKPPSESVFEQLEDPIRSEIFSGPRLESLGEDLARNQTITKTPYFGRKLTPRVAENKKVLEQSYEMILQAAKEQRFITPAAEWLIDNFHIVKGLLQDIHNNLPPKYYRELPKLNDGPFAGLPRVHSIAWAFVAHSDSLFDKEMLIRFIKAYQRVQPLKIGELWAISITIQVVLIENLRRLSVRIVGSQLARKKADEIADEVLGLGEGHPRTTKEIIRNLDSQSFGISFFVQLQQRLRFQDPKVNPILEWMDHKLAEDNLHADTAVTLEHNSQTAANASVRNIITSARLMSSVGWQDLFEEVSLVDQTLIKEDLTYGRMDFATRDRYRHALEQIARRSPLSEIEIAQKLIEISRKAQIDPGYYLISEGRAQFEKQVQSRPTLGQHLQRQYLRSGTDLYLGGIIIASLLIFLGPYLFFPGINPAWLFVCLGLLPASEIAIMLVNRITIALLDPQHLPRLNLEKGIPPEFKTFIVIPTLIFEKSNVDSQLEQLEIHFLSNPDGFVHFALLTDWRDSDVESSATDGDVIEALHAGIEKLNKRYAPLVDNTPRFYIFHRRRLWNPSEGRWMGWERKRGKLCEFNKLLLGKGHTSFLSPTDEPLFVPKDVRYVITLDSDTQLPKGAVANLVGTLAHPLNHAQFENGRVVKGYGILQPRMTYLLPAEHDSTLYQRLTSGPWGLDPYAVKVSDVYQDLFNEASYAGKGIYDIHAFEKALEGRVPENTLLSHDLLESQFARCGYLSDVEFFEDPVPHVSVAAARNHRWTRGDWQLLPWVLGRGGRLISIIGRWKMIDNLRRSLVAPSTIALMFLAFLQPEELGYPWILFCLLSLSAPVWIAFFSDLIKPRRSLKLSQKILFLITDFTANGRRFLMSLILLPYEAFISADAVLRSLYRQCISRRLLLQWTAAAQIKASASLKFKSFIRNFSKPMLLILLLLGSVFYLNPTQFAMACGFVILWLSSPVFAYFASRPQAPLTQRPLSTQEERFLKLTARRIWYFFTTFVSKEDHFLPPDNFQETPQPIVAHRSSPTNFGLYLLSILSAHDFGWLSISGTANRLTETLKTLKNLQKHKGHFYNWYETTDLRPLEPRYISSVDNGNLAGHLIATAQGCTEILQQPITAGLFQTGLSASFDLAEEELAVIQTESFNKLKQTLLKADKALITKPTFWKVVKDNLQIWKADLDTAIKLESQKMAQARTTLEEEILQWCWQFENLLIWTDILYGSTASLGPQTENLKFALKKLLPQNLMLKDFVSHGQRALSTIAKFQTENQTALNSESLLFIQTLSSELTLAVASVESIVRQLKDCRTSCYEIFNEMDFSHLFDPTRKLFSIGLRVAENELDSGSYDLLASEARLLSFIAIAKGDVPATHWFRLGRALTPVHNGAALISWSGSMFEYLMPTLVMIQPKGGLLEQTCQLIVQKQIEYGTETSVPWGVSESAYNQRDLHLTYQYSNFGVPGLALKRGLGAERVIAPYATILAAMYDPSAAIENLHRIESLDGSGTYGFYEAIDFTPQRLPKEQTHAVVKAYMAHHQGMSLIAILNIFKQHIMGHRFHREPMIQATELLLQERIPINVNQYEPPMDAHAGFVREAVTHVSRQYHSVHRIVPTTQLLSNGNYSVMLTSAGSGYSRSGSMAVTRWREDVTKDNWGMYFFLKDCKTQKIWSAAYQPTCVEGEHYEVSFSEDRARFTQENNKVASELEVFVSPESSAEIRRLKFTNLSPRVREIEITSYCEIVLNTQAADVAHPAFSNLFVETEYVPGISTLLASRRQRSPGDPTVWAAQVMRTDAHTFGEIEYESNRLNFLGRGREIRDAEVITNNRRLSNTVGSVLDPIFSLRTKIRLQPGATAHLAFSTIIGTSREEVLIQAENFHDFNSHERASQLAWTQAQVKLHHLNCDSEEAHLFQRLATRLIYLDSSLRPSVETLMRNQKDLTGLWAHGISGDFPIILVRIDAIEDRGLIRQLLKCQEYLASKGFTVDLVIINDKVHSYAQELQNSLLALAPTGTPPPGSARGKVFILRSDLLSPEDRLLLYAEARIVLSTRMGTLAEQVTRERRRPPALATRPLRRQIGAPSLTRPKLDFFNGTGGFSEDGREYVTIIERITDSTPAPWINVIANPCFGFQVSTTGAGYTWSQNSRENQITPWSNDPVADPQGEAFYIYDHESEYLWSPTAQPIQIENASYICRHGQGYTKFEHRSNDTVSELTQFVHWEKPVKISQLKIRNESTQKRLLSIYSYTELVLGFSRSIMAHSTTTEIDERTGALFASNVRNTENSSRIAFATFLDGQTSVTGDRSEFIGRNGSLKKPAGISRSQHLSGRTGAAMDPCAAFQKEIEIEAGGEVEVIFILGQADNREHAKKIILDLQQENIRTHLQKVIQEWDQILTQVQVSTPEKSFDLIVNRWLLYQTLVCRIWARSAFYQAGGAFGFRDQLQDVMSLVYAKPHLAREQILRAASRQFIEGDVQHWWHPSGKGVRTHFSDDLLWLPYVVFHYLKVTQDQKILDESISFLEAPLLRPDQEDSYTTPAVSHRSASLYEHCARTLDRSLKTGVHGLPLIGCGDWNDGMNRIGQKGMGESVWLAWFLSTNLQHCVSWATDRGDHERAQKWSEHIKNLKTSVENEAWDGDWYRRAFYDDGTPIGSAANEECKIDSLAQTWAVISKVADPTRAHQAMQALNKYLVKPTEDLILLFTPPFNKTELDPGYIKGYLPGVRENGGQYSHAATWCVIAYAMMEDGDSALKLFNILNPIHHALTPASTNKYKIEPYVIAGDVYSESPHTGRGGWSWYTGAAGWLYQSALEFILGFHLRGNELTLSPQISSEWNAFKINYRFGSSLYEISVENKSKRSISPQTAMLDGKEIVFPLQLVDDNKKHVVHIII